MTKRDSIFDELRKSLEQALAIRRRTLQSGRVFTVEQAAHELGKTGGSMPTMPDIPRRKPEASPDGAGEGGNEA